MPDEYDPDELEDLGESEPPVIDVLVKSYIEELDKVYSQIQMTALRYKLETAVGSDLDDIWGKTFQIKRYALESDEDYRSRLIVHTKVLMGSGTAPSCEAILDSLIGRSGATEIESRWPGVAYIKFADVPSLKLAAAAETKINQLRAIMFAAGISSEMLLPIEEYDLSLILKCPVDTTYDMDAMIQDEVLTDYDISVRFVRPCSLSYGIAGYIKKILTKQYTLHRGTMMFDHSADYELGAYIVITADTDYGLDVYICKTMYRDYSLSARMLAYRTKDYQLMAYMQRERPRSYGLSAIFEAA